MSEVWVNTTDYTPVELSLFIGGCVMWVIVYGIYAVNVIRFRFFEMPLIAAVSNFAWEALWTFAFKTDMGRFCEWLYAAWFVIDVFLVISAYRYADKHFTTELTQRLARPIFVASVLFFFPLYYFFGRAGLDTSIGARSAYICQLILSCLYVALLLSRKNTRGFSELVQWLRTYGTGLNTVMMLIHYPTDHFLHLLGITSFLVDHGAIWAFYRLRRMERATELEPAQLAAVQA